MPPPDTLESRGKGDRAVTRSTITEVLREITLVDWAALEAEKN